jgi:N-acetylneuraminic acid mutarotase
MDLKLRKSTLSTLVLSLFASWYFCSCTEPVEKKITVTAVNPTAGGIGAEIRIIGSGFGSDISDVQVFFNENAAETLGVADTMIVTRVPDGATTGNILVNVGEAAAEWSEVFNVLNGRWTRLADMPGLGRAYVIAFALGGKGYVTGGTDNGSSFNELYQYDPATDQWTQKASLPGAGRYKASVFTIDDKAYVGLGSINDVDSLESISLYEYDAAQDKWTKKANFPGGRSTFGVGFSIDGKGYAGLGGYLGNDAGFYQYDPQTDTWTELNPSAFYAYAGLGFAVDGAYYGGCSIGGPEQWWKYDPGVDEWTRLNDVPFGPRMFETAFSIGNKGYVSSGTTNVWEYDASNDTWTQKTSERDAQITFGSSSFSIDGKAYVGGGTGGNFTTKFFEFDPQ